MSVAGVISPAQVTGSVNSKNGFGGCTGNQGWKCDVKLTQNGEHSATRVYPPSSRDMKRFALGLSSCRRRSPNAAVRDESAKTWPSLAIVVVPEKFFLISPSHCESGRFGGS